MSFHHHHPDMIKSIRLSTLALLAIPMASSQLSSCASNEEFEQRMDKRNEGYTNYDERRRIRLDARQERTDAWYARAMR